MTQVTVTAGVPLLVSKLTKSTQDVLSITPIAPYTAPFTAQIGLSQATIETHDPFDPSHSMNHRYTVGVVLGKMSANVTAPAGTNHMSINIKHAGSYQSYTSGGNQFVAFPMTVKNCATTSGRHCHQTTGYTQFVGVTSEIYAEMKIDGNNTNTLADVSIILTFSVPVVVVVPDGIEYTLNPSIPIYPVHPYPPSPGPGPGPDPNMNNYPYFVIAAGALLGVLGLFLQSRSGAMGYRFLTAIGFVIAGFGGLWKVEQVIANSIPG